MTTRNGAFLAATAAVLFSSTSALEAVAAEAKIKCDGGNACKGKSECHTATNACAGQNSCKGKGYVSLTQAECAAAQNANREAEQGAKKP